MMAAQTDTEIVLSHSEVEKAMTLSRNELLMKHKRDALLAAWAKVQEENKAA